MVRPLLEIRELRAGYGQPVVGPLSLSLRPGEVLGLAGPNGCGKSTVLKALVGAARCFGGSVQRAADLRIAYQCQHDDGLEELPLNGGELLRLMQAGQAPLPARLQALLRTRLDRLSGGQRQLLMVWAALGHPAPLVLLDEPTNNLDPPGIELLAQRLQTLEPGRAALVVSHDSAFLQRVCHRVCELTA